MLALLFLGSAELARRAGDAWSPPASWASRAAPVVPVMPASPDRIADRAMRAEGCGHVTADGLGYTVIAHGPGHGAPRPDDTVTLRMSGWQAHGPALELPASPATFRVDQLVPGFALGLGRMTVGERRMLCIPASLAYRGRAGAPAGMLVFDVELLAIDRAGR